MDNNKTSILLIGEGGIPKDFPKNELSKFLNLKSKIESNLELSDEENIIFENLNNKIKKWKRNVRNDEYYHSIIDLKNLIYIKSKIKTYVAFLDYCEPDIYQAIENLIATGYKKIILITPDFILSKEKESKIDDILNFINIKYRGFKIINLCKLDYNIISDFFVNLVNGVIDGK